MTRTPVQPLSAEEAAVVARFDAAEVPTEILAIHLGIPLPPDERVEAVARALWDALPAASTSWDGADPVSQQAWLRLAAAAIAAPPPSPAEEAVKAAQRWIEEADSALRSATVISERMHRTGQVEGLNLSNHDRLVNSSQAVRAALASPAPAPQDDRAARAAFWAEPGYEDRWGRL